MQRLHPLHLRSIALGGCLAVALGSLTSAQSQYTVPIESVEALNALTLEPDLLVRARVGNAATGGAHELSVGSAAHPALAVADKPWSNGATENFRLTYDGFGSATFVMGSQTLIAPTTGAFDSMALTAKAPGGGARARIYNLKLNGVPVSKSAYAYSTTKASAFDGSIVCGASLRNGFVLTGRIMLSWPGALPAAQALVVEMRAGRLAPQVQRFCNLSNNSTGKACRIDWTGVTSISSNKFKLLASNGPPNAVCLYLVGATTVSMPYGNGTLCVGPPIERLADFLSFDAKGLTQLSLDLQQGPLGTGPLGVQPGDTRAFQVWFRDPASGSEDFNLSDALLATFLP